MKKRVTVHINVDLWNEFKRLAFAKHESFHGSISAELEQALQAWLAQHTQNHTKTLAVNAHNPQPRVYAIFQQVKEYLKRTFGYGAIVPGLQIPRKHLVEAISAVRGSDERTVNKWMKLFVQYKLVKWLAGEVYEVV